MSVYKNDSPIYLSQSVDSMLSQTVAASEIVIVKDGPVSTELNRTIDKYVKQNPDLFKVIQLKKNGGLGNALNEGLKNCSFELVARMDADDICFPDRCEKELKLFEANDDLIICGGQTAEFVGCIENVVSHRKVPTKYEEIVKFSHRRSPFNHPTVMYKKNDILSIGGYPSSNRKEDLDLFLLCLSKGMYALNLEDDVLFYRTSNDNYKRRKDKNNCKEFIRIIKKYYKNGYCSFKDYFVVYLGQHMFMWMPMFLVKFLDKKILRR